MIPCILQVCWRWDAKPNQTKFSACHTRCSQFAHATFCWVVVESVDNSCPKCMQRRHSHFHSPDSCTSQCRDVLRGKRLIACTHSRTYLQHTSCRRLGRVAAACTRARALHADVTEGHGSEPRSTLSVVYFPCDSEFNYDIDVPCMKLVASWTRQEHSDRLLQPASDTSNRMVGSGLWSFEHRNRFFRGRDEPRPLGSRPRDPRDFEASGLLRGAGTDR